MAYYQTNHGEGQLLRGSARWYVCQCIEIKEAKRIHNFFLNEPKFDDQLFVFCTSFEPETVLQIGLKCTWARPFKCQWMERDVKLFILTPTIHATAVGSDDQIN